VDAFGEVVYFYLFPTAILFRYLYYNSQYSGSLKLQFSVEIGCSIGGWLALWNLYSQALVTFLAFPFIYAGKFHQNDPDLVMVAQFPIFVPFCARLVSKFEKGAYMTFQFA
jgi:hypothetical protein